MVKNQKHPVLLAYDRLKESGKQSPYSEEMTELLGVLYKQCSELLEQKEKLQLISKVQGKEYFAFSNGKKLSRAINASLYDPSEVQWQKLSSSIQSNSLREISSQEIQKTLYTIAISFCSAIDMIKDGDQKTPGTFFEYFAAYFFTWRVGVNPEKSIQVLNMDSEDTRLPTDYTYNLGANKPKFHMPVKTSTRERSIMLWAHQKLLDGVYGTGRFMGTPVLLAETKLDKRKREVVEICLPEQWRLYQLYISKLKRIYYLDMPNAYAELNNNFPPLIVKPFSDFFFEWDELKPE